MPVSVAVEFPSENEIDIDQDFISEGTGSVEVSGKGNKLIIKKASFPGEARIFLKNGATVIINEDCRFGLTLIFALEKGVSIEIGAGCGFNGTMQISAHEKSSISIGRGCLFASDSVVMSSDVHRIYDVNSGMRLNSPGDISIGNRVWLGARVAVFRNAVIGDDNIVGFGSVVKGVFPANVLIAGVPARIIQTGVRWEG